MAKRSASKPQKNAAPEPARQPDLLENLECSEAAAVLKEILVAHPELRSEAEAIARDVLGEVSFLSIAEEVEDSLRQLDYDDLNGRAGRHSWGYTEPSEAAWELLEEVIEPQASELKRHLALGLKKEALAICQGLILGLYRVRNGAGEKSWVGRPTSPATPLPTCSSSGSRRAALRCPRTSSLSTCPSGHG